MSYTVDEKHPPSHPSAVYWERSLDPYHRDAWNPMFDRMGFPEPRIVKLINMVGKFFDKSLKRKWGWMGIDYYENPIIFVSDNTITNYEFPEFIFRKGPYTHTCAYPKDSEYTPDRIATHKEWMLTKAMADTQ